MQYYISETDLNGYVYSIDKLIIEYVLKDPTENVIDFIHKLIEFYPDIKDQEYYENLNKPYSSRWQYYNNSIHLCDGFFIQVGKWTINNEGDKTCFPILRIEYNPNKHAEKPIIQSFFKWIFEGSRYAEAELKRYDIAIDIPCKKEDVQVFGSRKEFGLIKGTRYYGQKNKDGYCKIYDKGKEAELDYDLTRIEHTFRHNKKGSHKKQGLSWESIYIKHKSDDLPDLKSKNMQVMYDLCVLLDANCIQYREILDKLDHRSKKTIMDAISGGCYEKFVPDQDIHDRLIDKVYDMYNIDKLNKPLEVDDQGFVKVDDSISLPFD